MVTFGDRWRNGVRHTPAGCDDRFRPRKGRVLLRACVVPKPEQRTPVSAILRGLALLRLAPASLTARDLSYSIA
jgi:hypothetical protein